MSLNLGDLAPNAQSLGTDLLKQLTGGLLSHVTDPAQIDLLSRATAKIAAGGIALVGPEGPIRDQATEDYNTGMAVLWSLASADVEDAAAAARATEAKLLEFVGNFVQVALTAAIRAIPLAIA